MKNFIFILSFVFSIHHAIGQKLNLEDRVNEFYRVQEDMNLSKEEKINQLRTFIIPGSKNEELAVYFYHSWFNLNMNSKELQTKIVKIENTEDGSKAFVWTEVIVTYHNGQTATFLSKTIWMRLKDEWYRGDKKSELYQNGKRIR